MISDALDIRGGSVSASVQVQYIGDILTFMIHEQELMVYIKM